MTATPPQGTKFDQGKLRWHLMPWDALEAILEVLEFGAQKYGDNNWLKGLGFDRPWSALQRHMIAWFFRREDIDPESGLSHLAHAGCCLMFLLAFVRRGRVELDSRSSLIAEQTKQLEVIQPFPPRCETCDGSGVIGSIPALQFPCGECGGGGGGGGGAQ